MPAAGVRGPAGQPGGRTGRSMHAGWGARVFLCAPAARFGNAGVRAARLFCLFVFFSAPAVTLDLSRIRAITLDLDDTLWPVWPTIGRAEAALQQWLAEHAPATHALQAENRACGVSCASRCSASTRSWRTTWARCARGRSGWRWCVRATTGAGRSGLCGLFCRAPARQAVCRCLARAGLPEPALPGGGLVQWQRRCAAGRHWCLLPCFGQRARCRRGQARCAHFSARRAGRRLAPEQVLHIGDDAHLDGVGALAVGMQMAWVNRAGHPWGTPGGRRTPPWPSWAPCVRNWARAAEGGFFAARLAEAKMACSALPSSAYSYFFRSYDWRSISTCECENQPGGRVSRAHRRYRCR